MKSILQQLYDGELYPAENIRCQTPEYAQIRSDIAAEREHFLSMLPEAERKRFNKFDDLQHDSTSIYGYESFLYGFRLGVRLMAETLYGRVELTVDKSG